MHQYMNKVLYHLNLCDDIIPFSNRDANSGALDSVPASDSPSVFIRKDSEFYGNHPIAEIYSC